VNAPHKKHLLLADDEPLYLQATSQLLRKAGYECTCVSDAHAAIEALKDGSIDLVLTDLNMPGNLKLELLRAGREQWPGVPLIVVTGVPSLPTAIESVRLGIADYLVKPVKFDVLLNCVRRVLESRESTSESPSESLAEGNARDPLCPPVPSIVGSSEPIRTLNDMIRRVAQSEANVLISGESGTGKELVAQAIHHASRRAGHKMQVIDCTSIPEPLFESILFGHIKGSFTGAVDDQVGLLIQADQGTAFFDEIGELPITLQPKLLRVIQEQTIVPVGKTEVTKLDTRFICATNRNLMDEVNADRFRRDLFYRLSVLHLEVPPLRERGDDVIELAHHFLRSLRPPGKSVLGFTDSCLQRFRQYPWPGNVRELRNAVESALALCDSPEIGIQDMPEWIRRDAANLPRPSDPALSENLVGLSRDQALGSTDKHYFEALMRQYNGNISRAAKHAQLSRQTLHKLLNKHGISAAQFRDPC
jgi:DNA-binding NtrC family response regulator